MGNNPLLPAALVLILIAAGLTGAQQFLPAIVFLLFAVVAVLIRIVQTLDKIAKKS